MNFLPPIQVGWRSWPVVPCAWCGEDQNANDNFGTWDAREHLARCSPYLASEEGHAWQRSDDYELISMRLLGRSITPAPEQEP